MMPTLAEQWVEQGREEGREEGIQRGVLMGSIVVLQQSLGLPLSSRDQLRHQDLQQLLSLDQQLRRQAGIPDHRDHH
jgi:predicted transposase YdaD